MNYIVFDLEWNQPMEVQESSVAGLPFEIIEIGAVKLNSEFEAIGKFSEVVKPQIYHKINTITQKLVHLDAEDLNAGRPFVDVAKEFLEFCGQDYIFCTWGQLDVFELQQNMAFFGLPALSTGPLKFYDVQKMFGSMYESPKFRRTLEEAVDALQIEKDVAFHRAYSDAYYTARIFQHMKGKAILERVSFDLFHIPETKEDEVYLVLSDRAKYITRAFENKEAALQDRQVMAMKCFLCNNNIRRKVKWFTAKGKHFYGVGSCEKHGLIEYKIDIKKRQDERVYVLKTARFIEQQDLDELLAGRERTRIMRQMKRKHKALLRKQKKTP